MSSFFDLLGDARAAKYKQAITAGILAVAVVVGIILSAVLVPVVENSKSSGQTGETTTIRRSTSTTIEITTIPSVFKEEILAVKNQVNQVIEQLTSVEVEKVSEEDQGNFVIQYYVPIEVQNTTQLSVNLDQIMSLYNESTEKLNEIEQEQQQTSSTPSPGTGTTNAPITLSPEELQQLEEDRQIAENERTDIILEGVNALLVSFTTPVLTEGETQVETTVAATYDSVRFTPEEVLPILQYVDQVLSANEDYETSTNLLVGVEAIIGTIDTPVIIETSTVLAVVLLIDLDNPVDFVTLWENPLLSGSDKRRKRSYSPFVYPANPIELPWNVLSDADDNSNESFDQDSFCESYVINGGFTILDISGEMTFACYDNIFCNKDRPMTQSTVIVSEAKKYIDASFPSTSSPKIEPTEVITMRICGADVPEFDVEAGQWATFTMTFSRCQLETNFVDWTEENFNPCYYLDKDSGLWSQEGVYIEGIDEIFFGQVEAVAFICRSEHLSTFTVAMDMFVEATTTTIVETSTGITTNISTETDTTTSTAMNSTPELNNLGSSTSSSTSTVAVTTTSVDNDVTSTVTTASTLSQTTKITSEQELSKSVHRTEWTGTLDRTFRPIRKNRVDWGLD